MAELIGWQVSGFRTHIAHFIYEDDEYLRKACGGTWWSSDAVTSRPVSNAGLCRNCLRTKIARSADGC